MGRLSRLDGRYARVRARCAGLLALCLLAVLLLGGCTVVRFNQKQRLGEDALRFDPNPLAAEMTGKVLSTREASIGGFHGSGAGGCGCN